MEYAHHGCGRELCNRFKLRAGPVLSYATALGPLFLLLLADLELPLHDFVVGACHEVTALLLELGRSQRPHSVLDRLKYQARLRYFAQLRVQVAQEKIKTIYQPLLGDAKSHNREEFDPLDHYLLYRFFSKLKKDCLVHLVKVH